MVMVCDGSVLRRYLVEGIIFAVGTPSLVGGYVAWWPPPLPELIGLVSLMYKMLDGVFMRKIWVKNLGSSLCPKPVMVAFRTCLKASLR
jgi:hypothetical protein